MKKNSTKRRPNLMQFTLSEECMKILDNFATKYGTSKSFQIERALKLLAGQYHRKIVISYELLTEQKSTTTTATEERHIPIKKSYENHPLNVEDEEIVSDAEIDAIINNVEKMKANALRKK